MKTLESERIRFRKITEEDLDDLASLYADPDVMRYYPRTRTKEETRECIKTYQQKYATEQVCLMAAIHKRENKFIGRCGIMLQEIEGEIFPEVGYMLDKFFWRGGLGTEAAIAFRDYGFRELGYPKIISIIHPLNLASQGVAKNMGMTFERTAIYDNVECQIFSITKEQWEGLQSAPPATGHEDRRQNGDSDGTGADAHSTNAHSTKAKGKQAEDANARSSEAKNTEPNDRQAKGAAPKSTEAKPKSKSKSTKQKPSK